MAALTAAIGSGRRGQGGGLNGIGGREDAGTGRSAWRRWGRGGGGGHGGVNGGGGEEEEVEGVGSLAVATRRRKAWRDGDKEEGVEEEGVEAGTRRRAWWYWRRG